MTRPALGLPAAAVAYLLSIRAQVWAVLIFPHASCPSYSHSPLTHCACSASNQRCREPAWKTAARLPLNSTSLGEKVPPFQSKFALKTPHRVYKCRTRHPQAGQARQTNEKSWSVHAKKEVPSHSCHPHLGAHPNQHRPQRQTTHTSSSTSRPAGWAARGAAPSCTGTD